MAKKEITFNDDIALKVFTAFKTAWEEGRGIFKGYRMPQDQSCAILDPRDRANYLFFFSLPMVWGSNSDAVAKWVWELWQQYPDLFRPEKVSQEYSPEKIKDIIQSVTVDILNNNGKGGKERKPLNLELFGQDVYGNNTQGATTEILDDEKNGKKAGPLSVKLFQHAINWYRNSVILHKHFGDDCRNIFEGVGDFEEAFARIDHERNEEAGMGGIRRKIFSLATELLQEAKLIHHFPSLFPVDFQALRLVWGTEIVDFGGYARPFNPGEKYPKQFAGKLAIRIYERHTDAVATWGHKFLSDHGFSHIMISFCLWVFGRTHCKYSFQNSSLENRTRYIEDKDLIANPGLWPKNYTDPCVSCPIEKFCKWAIPSGPFYHMNWGILVRVSRRIPYNGPSLLLPFDWQKIPFIKGKRS